MEVNFHDERNFCNYCCTCYTCTLHHCRNCFGITYSLEGKLIAINQLAGTLTVKTDEDLLQSPVETMGEYTFSIDKMTNIQMCNQNEIFRNVKVGDRVKVIYHEKGSSLIADNISITTPLLACLIE